MKGFQNASVRGVLPVDPKTGQQGFSFDLEDGSIVRLKLGVGCAATLSALIIEYRETYQADFESGATCQSSMSSGSPHSDGSPQSGQKVVPPTKSSKAEIGNA